MLRLTLAQMRRSLARLTAAGIAIAIGTAFVAATLLAGGVITRTSLDAVSASFADADLVVSHPAWLPVDVVDELQVVDGVAAAEARLNLHLELSAGARRVVPEITAAATDPRLDAQTVTDGRGPRRSGEVALPGPLAERLAAAVGDDVTVHVGSGDGTPIGVAEARPDPVEGAGTDAGGPPAVPDPRPGPTTLRVVGLLADPSGAFAQSGGAAVVTRDDLLDWARGRDGGATPRASSVVVALDRGADPEVVRAAIAALSPEGSLVRTKDEQAEAIAAELTDSTDVFTSIVLGFAAVALVVAALVIANTFSVLVAQRTRTLALLRCVGADRVLLQRSVLLEAGLLGLAASTAGLLGGVGIAQSALWVLGRLALDVPLPATVTVTPPVVVAPMLVGVLVTVLASLAPARAATRVAPLAALRPADAPAVTHRRDLPRLVLAVVLTVGGLALLAVAVVLAGRAGSLLVLGVGVVGGALSFVGVLLGSVFWLPRAVGLAGRALGRTGTSARLAAANTARNPRRTAATSTALLIGVTLVTMMSTGAASARATLGAELDRQFPVDLEVGPAIGPDGQADRLPPSLLRRVADVPGVEHVVAVTQHSVRLVTADGSEVVTSAVGLTPGDAAGVLRPASMVDGLTDATLALPRTIAEGLALTEGDTVTLSGVMSDPVTGEHRPTGPAIELTVVVAALPSGPVVTPLTLDRLTGTDIAVRVWARIADSADPGRVVPAVQDALVDTAVPVTGAAVERARFAGIIDTLLAVVVGLLGVAVVIALVGVANTLSLSVLERRRESATLRVIGLSRRQLRGTLAIEGVLVAGVGAALGAALGVLYGWAGAVTVLSTIGDVSLDVPWTDLAVVLAVAVVAGLLASVLPGRSAARTSPVAALAVE